MTRLFVEQPLALPGSANKGLFTNYGSHIGVVSALRFALGAVIFMLSALRFVLSIVIFGLSAVKFVFRAVI